MYKRIIFDLDNTLIIWKNEYIKGLENSLKYFNLEIDSNIIDKLIDSLEYKYEKISKEILLKEINETCNLDLNMSFVDKLFEEQKKLSFVDEEVIDTLEYLSKKYDLIVLTNYFTEVQVGRLKNAKMDKYFKRIIGGDMVLQKPNPLSFKEAVGDFDKKECLMIGDNLDVDINGALNFGIDAIVCDYSYRLKDSTRYKIIRRFSELKEIL